MCKGYKHNILDNDFDNYFNDYLKDYLKHYLKDYFDNDLDNDFDNYLKDDFDNDFNDYFNDYFKDYFKDYFDDYLGNDLKDYLKDYFDDDLKHYFDDYLKHHFDDYLKHYLDNDLKHYLKDYFDDDLNNKSVYAKVINTCILILTIQGCNMDFKDTLNEAVVHLIEAGGQAAGKLEIINTPLATIRKFALNAFPSLDSDIPDFDENYAFAQKVAKKGSEQRKDMPVITDADVKMLQHALKSGKLDISAPFGKNTDKSNPFPQGISGKEAKAFLEGGLKINDGDRDDDKVKVKATKERVGDLKPIQKQIYADKSVGFYTFGPIKSTRNFLSNKSFFIVSSDNYIIDGHHRWLAAVLLDPDMKVNCLKIDIPKKKLVELLLAYGDAIGNSRNQ